VELTRRANPAELSSRSAMRELSNTQAHIAITVHLKKRLLHKAACAWGLGLACAMMTVFVRLITSADAVALRTVALSGVVVGMYFMVQGLAATQQYLFTERRSRAKAAENSAPAKPPKPEAKR
jgi:hypothetical protein